MKFVKDLKRSHLCGRVDASLEGQEVVLMGWVDTRRDHGGLIFIDVRDHSGIVQVVLNPGDDNMAVAKDFRNEYVVAIQGKVRRRPEGMVNKKIPTGEVEIESSRCEILTKAETPPIQVSDDKVTESLRLKYRYLDLRSEHLQSNLRMRHNITQTVRNALSDMDFIEVETPILYKSTPEGARDYLVPSRVSQGQFYALPQSPQTLKQLLMIGGTDRYFQIARCFRDEDLRADRQPEFSQIDIEMSFVDVEDIISMTEVLVRKLWKDLKDQELEEIPRMTYHEAMETYGSDKPDLRVPWTIKDIAELVKDSGFKVFTDTVSRGDRVRALAIPGMGSYSRGQMDKATKLAQEMGAKGLVWIKESDGQYASPVSKFFPDGKLEKLFSDCGGEAGGAVLIIADTFDVSSAALSALRLSAARELGAIDTSKPRFLWVTDFPLFEYSPEESRWVAKHHPFTCPSDEDLEILKSKDEKNFKNIRAKAYDFVCDGNEIAGGSIRIHDQNVQKLMFEALGFSEEETKQKFGFFCEALSYGTPPHGGIAWGLDRLAMILCGTEAIRDVIAFPKTTKATDLMAEAPNDVKREQLLELGIRLNPSLEKNKEN